MIRGDQKLSEMIKNYQKTIRNYFSKLDFYFWSRYFELQIDENLLKQSFLQNFSSREFSDTLRSNIFALLLAPNTFNLAA